MGMMSTLIVVIGDDAFLWWPMIPVVVLTVVRVQTLIDNSEDCYNDGDVDGDGDDKYYVNSLVTEAHVIRDRDQITFQFWSQVKLTRSLILGTNKSKQGSILLEICIFREDVAQHLYNTHL